MLRRVVCSLNEVSFKSLLTIKALFDKAEWAMFSRHTEHAVAGANAETYVHCGILNIDLCSNETARGEMNGT